MFKRNMHIMCSQLHWRKWLSLLSNVKHKKLLTIENDRDSTLWPFEPNNIYPKIKISMSEYFTQPQFVILDALNTYMCYFVVPQENEVLHANSEMKDQNVVDDYIPLCTSEDLNSCGTETSSASSNDSELRLKPKKGFLKKCNLAIRRIFSSKW